MVIDFLLRAANMAAMSLQGVYLDTYRDRESHVVHGELRRKGHPRPGRYLCGEFRVQGDQYRPPFAVGDSRNALTCDGCVEWLVALQDWSEG